MDSSTINRLLQKIFVGKKQAQYGCIPSNGLDNMKIKTYPFAFCVNDMPAGHPGSHWLGLYIEDRNKPLEFFCSFGRPMSSYPPNFTMFVKRNKLSVKESNICLQSLTSDRCGQHVLYYLYNRRKECSRKCFYDKFSNDVIKNDKIVVAFVNKFITKN